VGLVGRSVVRELFGGREPVGKYLIVGRLPVQVVGVLSERGMSGGGHDMDNRIVMPITTVMRKILNESQYITAFRIRFLDQENLEERQEEIRLFLREIMKTPYDEPDEFRIISPTLIVQFLVALTGSLIVFIGVAGVICLIVAGFVLANLFLLSVRERTKEIGIRRAVGARRRDILVQFLEEALLVTTAGGFLGFLLALGGARLLTAVAAFPIHFSWKPFAIGLVLAWIVGITFGLQPARRAALIEPIEAIRE
jgi:putative ABC transport system permease protein